MPSLCRTEPPPRRSTRRFSTRFCRPQRDLASLAGDGTVFASGAREKLEQLRAELEPLARRYDVVVANPPYMGSGNMNKWLSAWVKSQYASTCKDLCTCFISRGISLALANGYEALITSDTCMYISSFEKMRKEIIDRTTIVAFIDTRGTNAHPDVFDANAGWILWNSTAEEFEGSYFKLNQPIADKEARLLEALADPDCGWAYRVSADTYTVVPGSPIAYWISKSLSSAFSRSHDIGTGFEAVVKGIFTGNNNRFLRYWHEVNLSAIGRGWMEYAKGGAYRKWFGNVEHVVDWEDDAHDLRSYEDSGLGAARYFGAETISWTKISSGAACFRWNSSDVYFDDASPAFVLHGHLGNDERIVLGFLNSSISRACLSFLAPTLNFQCGDIRKLPFLRTERNDNVINRIVDENISLSRDDWGMFETSRNFRRHPLI